MDSLCRRLFAGLEFAQRKLHQLLRPAIGGENDKFALSYGDAQIGNPRTVGTIVADVILPFLGSFESAWAFVAVVGEPLGAIEDFNYFTLRIFSGRIFRGLLSLTAAAQQEKLEVAVVGIKRIFAALLEGHALGFVKQSKPCSLGCECQLFSLRRSIDAGVLGGVGYDALGIRGGERWKRALFLGGADGFNGELRDFAGTTGAV